MSLPQGELFEFSRYSIEGGHILGELQRSVGQFLNLQESLLSMSGDDSQETEKAFMTFVNSIAESEATVDELRQSSAIFEPFQGAPRTSGIRGLIHDRGRRDDRTANRSRNVRPKAGGAGP